MKARKIDAFHSRADNRNLVRKAILLIISVEDHNPQEFLHTSAIEYTRTNGMLVKTYLVLR